MADPLSITASIIAVVGAAEGVTKTLAKIKNIRNAPEELLALINEVSDLQIVLGDIQSYTQTTTISPPIQDAFQHLSVLIDRARNKLLQLDELIQYRLTKPESAVGRIKVSRREWATARTTIDNFRQSLRDIKLNIIAQMGVINSREPLSVTQGYDAMPEYITALSRRCWISMGYGVRQTIKISWAGSSLSHQGRLPSMINKNASEAPSPMSPHNSFHTSPLTGIYSSYQSRIGLTINEIYMISSQLRSDQSNTNSRTAQQLNEHSRLLTNILSSQSNLHDLLQTGREPDEPVRTPPLDVPIHNSDRSSSQVVYIRASYQKRSPCPPNCNCDCHTMHTLQSPAIVNHVIGGLFVGYSGYPITGNSHKCTKASCLSRTTFRAYVQYIFPSWFLARAIVLGLTTQSLNKISVSLKVQRVVPNGSEIFRLAWLDDVDGLKELFRKGLASPNDISLHGFNALDNANIRPSMNTLSFLLQAGADPQNRSLVTHRSTYDYVWSEIFLASENQDTLKTLRSLFPLDDDYLEDRQFSLLHKIVLGIYSHDLKKTLAIVEDQVDIPDVDGRTPLIWASWRGDVSAVKHLLKAKAGPNLTSINGVTALMNASKSGSTECLKLLLAAGADPLLITNDGWNALHYSASYQDQAENIKVLLSAGTNVHGRTVDGTPPLVQAVMKNHAIAVTALLDYGANVDLLDNEGDSALHESIHNHADNITQLLLSRGATYTLWDSNGDSVLHLAAKCGGNRTVEIMIAAGLHGVDPDALNRERKFALQLARERERTEEGFVEKFEELLEDIRARNATLKNEDPNSPSDFSWLHSIYTLLKLKPTSPRRPSNSNNPNTRSKTALRIYCFLGLCLISCGWIYPYLEMGQVASLLRLIWDMVDPGELEGL